MDRVRIQEIADEAGVSNAELIKKAKELGYDVKAANSTVTVEQAGVLVDYVMDDVIEEINEETSVASSKNYDKYRFNNESSKLSKGRLAERIVREYLKDNPTLNYKEIKQEFDFKTSGHAIVYNEEDYSRWDTSRNSTQKRYSGPIKHNGENYYVTTQWNVETISKLIEKVRSKFNYNIEIIKNFGTLSLIEEWKNFEINQEILEEKEKIDESF